MKEKHNILCISPTFVPFADSEAFCGAKMILALRNEGIKVTVFTIARADGLLTGSLDDSKLWKSAIETVLGIDAPVVKNYFLSVKTAVQYHTDYWARSIDNAVAQARRIHNTSPFTIVYSRSLPMFAHIAGYWCSKVLKIPWVANINDPWDFHMFPTGPIKASSTHNAISRYWLRKTLHNADLITYPCYRLWKFHEKLSGVKHNCSIIPHIGYHVNGGSNRGKFNLIHAGKLGSNELSGRPTSTLMKGLSRFFDIHTEARSNTQLTLVGPIDAATQSMSKDYGIESNVNSTGRVSYENSLQYIHSASVCILIENDLKEGIYLPSKLTDYLVAQKPLLSISPMVGTVNDMLPNKGIIRVNHGDVIGFANALSVFYKHFSDCTMSEIAPSDDLAKQFMPDTVVNGFLSAIKEEIGLLEH
jgi:hypothetical protein